MRYLRNPLQTEEQCVFVCACVRERGEEEEERGVGCRPKNHVGEGIVSNQSEMKKCKSFELQKCENAMTSRETIDFRNEMSHHFLTPKEKAVSAMVFIYGLEGLHISPRL